MSTLKKLREYKGLSQAALAQLLGVDQSAVSLWEKGKTMPRVSVAIRLAKILGCTLDEVYQANAEDDASAS